MSRVRELRIRKISCELAGGNFSTCDISGLDRQLQNYKYAVEVPDDGTLSRVILGFTEEPTEDERLIIKSFGGVIVELPKPEEKPKCEHKNIRHLDFDGSYCKDCNEPWY